MSLILPFQSRISSSEHYWEFEKVNSNYSKKIINFWSDVTAIIATATCVLKICYFSVFLEINQDITSVLEKSSKTSYYNQFRFGDNKLKKVALVIQPPLFFLTRPSLKISLLH